MTTKSSLKFFTNLYEHLTRRLNLKCLVPTMDDAVSARKRYAKKTVLLCALIFTLATGVRLLQWLDVKADIESGKMSFGMTQFYQADAQNLLAGRLGLFISGPAPPSDADIMTHPPGYPLLLALIFKLFGNSETVWRFVQIILDSLVAMMIFLIAAKLLPRPVAVIAGALVALSPQLAYTSLVLLPDSPSILPIALAVFLIIRAYKRPGLLPVIGAGVLVGVSCWIRPNALLLSPFLALAIFVMFERARRWRYALAMLAATILIIAPITLRNILVFHHFIPLSLGAGHNISVGIAEYDDENRFGLLKMDHLVRQWEAQVHNRPEYAGSLFAPDGIEREGERFKRGFAVIKTHPFWFTGVMLRRVGFMLTYEHTPIISPVPTATHSLAAARELTPAWSSDPAELLAVGALPSNSAAINLSEDKKTLFILGDDSHEAQQFVSAPIPLEPGTDYVLNIPFDITEGRMVVRITKGDGRTLLASAAIPDALQGLPPDKQSNNLVQIPFVSGSQHQMRIVISNGGSNPVRPSARVGRMELFALGSSSYGWTRVPRLLVRAAQKFYTTKWMLPLILFGLTLLILARRGHALVFLLVVPLYYLSAQAPLHTEYRYVIAIQYFLLVMAAVSLYWLGLLLRQGAHRLWLSLKRRTAHAVS